MPEITWTMQPTTKTKTATPCEWCGLDITVGDPSNAVYVAVGGFSHKPSHFRMHCCCYRAWRSDEAHAHGLCSVIDCGCWTRRHMPYGRIRLGGGQFPNSLATTKTPKDAVAPLGSPLVLEQQPSGKFSIVPSFWHTQTKGLSPQANTDLKAKTRVAVANMLSHKDSLRDARINGFTLLAQQFFTHFPAVWKAAGLGENEPLVDIVHTLLRGLEDQYPEWFADPFCDTSLDALASIANRIRLDRIAEVQDREEAAKRNAALITLRNWKQTQPMPPIPKLVGALAPPYLQIPPGYVLVDDDRMAYRLQMEDQPLRMTARLVLRKPAEDMVGVITLIPKSGTPSDLRGTFRLIDSSYVVQPYSHLLEWGNTAYAVGDYVIVEPPGGIDRRLDV